MRGRGWRSRRARGAGGAFLHLVHVDEEVQDLSASSKLNAEWGYLRELFDRGRRWADVWLRDNFERMGGASTLDLDRLFEEAPRPAGLPPKLRRRVRSARNAAGGAGERRGEGHGDAGLAGQDGAGIGVEEARRAPGCRRGGRRCRRRTPAGAGGGRRGESRGGRRCRRATGEPELRVVVAGDLARRRVGAGGVAEGEGADPGLGPVAAAEGERRRVVVAGDPEPVAAGHERGEAVALGQGRAGRAVVEAVAEADDARRGRARAISAARRSRVARVS